MRRSYAVWRAFWSDRRAAVAAVFLLVEIALVLFLPLFLGQDPNLTDRSAGFWAAPSAQHWLGTDDVGRDLFARLLYGGRTSLLVGFASAALGLDPAGAVHRGHGLGPAAGGGGVTKSLESPQTLTEGHDCLFLPAGVE